MLALGAARGGGCTRSCEAILRAIDRRTTRHSGYAVSGRVRKRIEEVFGWTKTAAGFRKTRHRGLARVDWMFTLTATANNLVRLPKLVGAVA